MHDALSMYMCVCVCARARVRTCVCVVCADANEKLAGGEWGEESSIFMHLFSVYFVLFSIL